MGPGFLIPVGALENIIISLQILREKVSNPVWAIFVHIAMQSQL